MVCVYCSSKTKIVNSRFQRKLNNTWRRHRCLKCNALFTSIEAPQLDSLWVVKKANKSFMPFRRNKLLISLYSSLKHRRNALDDASALTFTVIQKLKPVDKGVIDIDSLRQTVYIILKRFDKAAAVHYKAFHNEVE